MLIQTVSIVKLFMMVGDFLLGFEAGMDLMEKYLFVLQPSIFL